MARIVPTLEPGTSSDTTRTIMIFAAVIASLYFGSEIFVPIALAILLSFVLAPAVRAMQKLGLGRAVPVGITVLLTVVVIAGLGVLVASQLRDLAVDLPRYETIMIRKIQTVRSMSDSGAAQRLEEAVARFASAVQPSRTTSSAPHPATASGPEAAPAVAPPPMPVEIVQPALGPIDAMLIVAAPLLHPLATGFIVLIFVVFVLLQREDLRNRAIRLFGASDLQRATAAINDGAKRLSRYLLTQCAMNAGAGVVVATALWAIGVPSPLLLGLLFACMRFVPYVGPVIGSVLPVALAAAVDPGWSMVLWTVAALVVVELIVGQLVEPFAYGHNTGLSPIAVVLAATFWTVLWGPVGLLLSTPLTVCLVVLGRHVESLDFLDVLLGDRPPLSPSEIFYQRMLANDPAEAADHAHRCLETMSIATYLDEVALPALILAQDDASQGRLDVPRQAQIRDAAMEVVEDMTPDSDAGAAPERRFWRFGHVEGVDDKREVDVDTLSQEEAPAHLTVPGSVLCLGSRGPLDDAAAAMLAKVLIGYGIGARAETFGKLSKAEIEALDVSQVRLICLSALDGSSVAFLRFALRRLQRQAPGATILVGAWWRRSGLRDVDDAVEDAVKRPKASTLIDAVRFCLAQREDDAAADTALSAGAVS
jgi:predicted PurR-regulated permease PerM